MSLSPNQMYPGSTLVDTNYKDGKYKDSTAVGVYDGTPLNNLMFNQNLAFQDAIMNAAQLTYSGTSDTPATSQLFTALELSRSVVNRFEGNQNFNVQSDDNSILPNSVSRSYSVGSEFTAGKFVTGATLFGVKYTGGLLSASSGSYYVEYDGNFSNNFYGIKLADNTISQTGVSLSVANGKTRITVNMATAPSHKFVGLSEKKGVWPDISDFESKRRYEHKYNYILVTANTYSANGDEFFADKVTATSSLPQNISTKNRYTITNPFGTNVRFEAIAEVFVNGVWTPTIGGFAGDDDSTGIIAGYVRSVGLVIQTAKSALANAAALTLNLSNGTGSVSSAPCRIWCKRV